MKKIIDLKHGDKFYLRGGKTEYRFIAYICDRKETRGMAFMQNIHGKERCQRMFPFTLVKVEINKPSNI